MLDEQTDDLREQLQTAFKEARDDAAETPESGKAEPAKAEPAKAEGEQSGRVRDEHGRFIKPADAKAQPSLESQQDAAPELGKGAAADDTSAARVEQPASVLAPPNGWSAEAKAKWHELSPEIQAAVAKREQDIAKFTGKTDEERSFGREMQRAVQPYIALIQSEGSTPAQAVQSLLNTAYILRMGSPQAKQQALIGVARQFGVPFDGLAQHGVQTAPEVAALQQELAQLRNHLTQREQIEQQQTQVGVQSEIDAFASDPKNSHFSEVKAHMAALLGQGLAKDLQDAYDQACHARPDIRATLQAQSRAEEEQKRRSEEQQRAVQAKRKNVSVIGGPGATGSKSAPSDRSLREELQANFAAARAAV